MIWLAIVGVIFSVIGAFYYLRIVKLMYFDKPQDSSPALVASFDTRLMVSINSLLILFLGLFPGGLLALCQAAFPG
jgi:NADH-quinone oxidoreductase subunit N